MRRWAAPIALAFSVAASVGAANVLPDDASSGAPHRGQPRFVLTVSQDGGRGAWFEVHAIQARPPAAPRPVGTVPRPAPSAGAAREIVEGPSGTFVVVSSRDEPCESRLHRFELTDDGRARGIAPLTDRVEPARVAGLAMSPDGDRVAYATAPCAKATQPRAALTVLDLDSGRRRTWSASGPSIVGDIVWADDGRTLGYALSDLPTSDPGRPSGTDVANTTVHALDTEARNTDLRAGRVLFRQPGNSGAVTSAVMKPDGRTGHGTMKKNGSGSTVLFAFTEGKPMRVTGTIQQKPNTIQLVAVSADDDPPRYACLGGIDAFGRTVDGDFTAANGLLPCSSALAY